MFHKDLHIKKTNFKKAFSIMELVLYVGILSGLTIVSSNMFYSLSKGNGQSQARNEVNSSIRFATEKIKQDIKNASSVSSPSSGQATSSLSMTINGTTVVYDVSQGALRRKEGLADPVSITPVTISVDAPLFTRIENTNSVFNVTVSAIQVNILFRYNSTNPDWNYSSELQTTVNLTADNSSSYVGTYSYDTVALNITKNGTGVGTVTSSPVGINCGSTCSYNYPQGEATYVTLTESTLGTFGGWGGDCSSSGTNETCRIAMSAVRNVSATFTAILPTVTTTSPVANITQTIATGGGTITSDGGATVTTSGIVWDTSENPTIALSTKTSEGWAFGGPWENSMSGLNSATIYHVRAYATNSVGTAYGSDVTFTTLAYAPTVTTTTASSIAQNTASSGGNITSDGGASITAKGVVWDTSANPTIALSTKTSDGTGTGSFLSSLTGLTENTTYHYRAYATNSVGTSYGSDLTFTTEAAVVPTVSTTSPVTNITTNSATGGGTISTNGGATVITSGIVWDTSLNPTIALATKTTDGWASGGPWPGSITGLTENTLYHVRAYATNSAGTGYGSDVTFTTASSVTTPTVTTTDPSSIAQTTTSSGGEVVTDGGASVTARGVVWDTSANPTIALSTKTSDGTGTGIFSSSITGLTENTLYHVRAYATNSAGTSYGADKTFNTLQLPTVTSPTQASVATTSATLGANVTSLGYPASISARGTCLGTSANPTGNCVAEGGTTTGVFTHSRTGLTAGTLYYYRGYATNSTGTSYTSDDSFTTLQLPTVTSPTQASVATTSATLGANVTSLGYPASISARGVCYGTSPSPTNCVAQGGTTTGVFTQSVSSLSTGTLYYYRGYATNSTGTSYTSDDSFTTLAVPTLTSPTATSISTTSAVIGWNLTNLGNPGTITQHGSCYNTSPTPRNNCQNDGAVGSTGVDSHTRTGLTPNTTYYYAGFAKNSTGYGYTADGTFTTLSVPTVTSPTSSSVGSTSATLGANVTSLGYPASISARGTCLGTSANPTGNCVAQGGTTTGVFTHSRTGLTAGTLYYYRGYATNSTGTAYSADGTFTTTSACGGYSYNGYCWYKQTVQGQTCNTYCTGIGKTCVNSTQTCAQDKTVYTGVGKSCGSYSYDSNYNNQSPLFDSGTYCNPRTNTQWSCGTGNVTTASCTNSRSWWYMVCSCSS